MAYKNNDAKKNQEGEAYPCKQPSAVGMTRGTKPDGGYKAGMAPMVGGQVGHGEIHAAPGKGEKGKNSGKNSDFEGMTKS